MYSKEVEIHVMGSLVGGTIISIESLTEGVEFVRDKGSSDQVYKVKENGTYIFRITGSNGRRIKVSCTVTNAIPIKTDLLTAIADVEFDGVSKCRVIGKTYETAEPEEVIYSFNTIMYDGDLVLDGYSNVKGAVLKEGFVYEFGNEKDVSDGINYAENTVVLKVNGNLTIKQGVTLTSVVGKKGGPKGLIVYCTGIIQNDGSISMTARGAYAEGDNVYILKNDENSYEFVPKIGGKGALKGNSAFVGGSKVFGLFGENGINRSTGGGGGGDAWVFREAKSR